MLIIVFITGLDKLVNAQTNSSIDLIDLIDLIFQMESQWNILGVIKAIFSHGNVLCWSVVKEVGHFSKIFKGILSSSPVVIYQVRAFFGLPTSPTVRDCRPLLGLFGM